MSSITIEVTFTGICAFIEHQQSAIVIIPNAAGVKGVSHEGMHAHVPGHLPFLEYDADDPPVPSAPGNILFSYRKGGKHYDVLKLNSIAPGVSLWFAPVDGGAFTPMPPSLNWTNVVEMDAVVGTGNPIDESLISSFDPRSDRVAARISVNHGTLTPVPRPDVYAMFVPPDSPPYSGTFVQEVTWVVTYTGGTHCALLVKALGGDGPGETLLAFDGVDQDEFKITMGNAPIEDILGSGQGARDIVDHHFALYYDLLLNEPETPRLPHRTSEKYKGTRSGSSNCPPAKLSTR
jgi:hypothetical protein